MKTHITLYLDMDGVLCNFDKAYKSLRTHAADGKRFRAAVMEFKIFEDLEFMPDTTELLNYVSKLDDINIEILTSMGTYDEIQGNAAKYQKMHWLNKNNIPYKANFVRSKQEKANFAHPHAILVDDSTGCIDPFNTACGHGILHTKSSDTIQQIHDTIRIIHGLDGLRFGHDSLGSYA
jgi:hypothetical protein